MYLLIRNLEKVLKINSTYLKKLSYQKKLWI